MGADEVTCGKCGVAYEHGTLHSNALCEARQERDALGERVEALEEMSRNDCRRLDALEEMVEEFRKRINRLEEGAGRLTVKKGG